MRSIVWAIFSVLMTIGSVLAADGPSTGGGGASVICRGSDNKIKTAELLDLYEARVRYGLQTPKSNESVQEQFGRAYGRLVAFNWFLGSDTDEALRRVISKIAYLPPGVVMAPGVDLGDSYAALIPDGCELSYVGYYEADGTLRVSRTIFDQLSQTDRAALLMHEALYKVARDLGNARQSLSTRVVTGFLFSNAQDLSQMRSYANLIGWTGRAEQFDRRPDVFQYAGSYLVAKAESKLTIETEPGVEVNLNYNLGGNRECMDAFNPSKVYRIFDRNDGSFPEIPSSCRYFDLRAGLPSWKGGTDTLKLNFKYGDKVVFSYIIKGKLISRGEYSAPGEWIRFALYPSRTIQLPAMPF